MSIRDATRKVGISGAHTPCGAGDGRGGVLLQRNPLKGFKSAKEKNPSRVVLTENEYKAVLGVATQMDWRFKVALILAHETGHRIGAIRQLRWSDIDFAGGNIRWRAEHEKTGYEHVTPITEAARSAKGLMWTSCARNKR